MTARPPFKADHVGSFLRPGPVAEARARYRAGSCTAEELKAIEDDCIRELVRREEAVGLRGITDGEYRREMFHTDFLQQLHGVEVHYDEFEKKFHRADGEEVGFRPPTMHVTDRIAHVGPIQAESFEFLKSVVTQTPKVSIPAPSMLHFRGGRQAISEEVYPDLEAFYDDLTAAYRAEIADLAQRGCRYLQLDDTNLAYLCDPNIRDATARRGDDPDDLTRTYARLINDAVKDRPAEMTVTVHLCRGNFRSAWVAEGGYEPVAEILFNDLEIDGFFLEYDDERSGDFAPLRLMPRDKSVVLGLMSSKRPDVEPADEVKQRIEEAGAYVDLDQCGLSHQCGFSSTSEGNEISDDDQWRKLERCVAIAEDVWGSV